MGRSRFWRTKDAVIKWLKVGDVRLILGLDCDRELCVAVSSKRPVRVGFPARIGIHEGPNYFIELFDCVFVSLGLPKFQHLLLAAPLAPAAEKLALTAICDARRDQRNSLDSVNCNCPLRHVHICFRATVAVCFNFTYG